MLEAIICSTVTPMTFSIKREKNIYFHTPGHKSAVIKAERETREINDEEMFLSRYTLRTVGGSIHLYTLV